LRQNELLDVLRNGQPESTDYCVWREEFFTKERASYGTVMMEKCHELYQYFFGEHFPILSLNRKQWKDAITFMEQVDSAAVISQCLYPLYILAPNGCFEQN